MRASVSVASPSVDVVECYDDLENRLVVSCVRLTVPWSVHSGPSDGNPLIERAAAQRPLFQERRRTPGQVGPYGALAAGEIVDRLLRANFRNLHRCQQVFREIDTRGDKSHPAGIAHPRHNWCHESGRQVGLPDE